MTVKILTGDCREVLKTLPDESVHCVVTSPPYWGLRDYGVVGQIGLEPDFRDYLKIMVEVFREIKRVLRKDGTCWVNMGDNYVGAVNGRSARDSKIIGGDDRTFRDKPFSNIGNGLKPKDMAGMPWRLAFALQEDGWWLRSDIIWSKPNPMPESIRDRPTKAHEYLFLLAKSERYYYDAEAIREDVALSQHGRIRSDIIGGKSWKEREQHSIGGRYETRASRPPGSRTNGGALALAWESGERTGRDGEGGAPLCHGPEVARPDDGITRNRRTVWEIATAPFSEAHFATFPPALVEPCIKAGCPKDGTVLDPFGGAGTVGLVADRLGRNAILIELNPEYAKMAEQRLSRDAGLFSSVERETPPVGGGASLTGGQWESARSFSPPEELNTTLQSSGGT